MWSNLIVTLALKCRAVIYYARLLGTNIHVCVSLYLEQNFDLLTSFPNIWTLPPFQWTQLLIRIYSPFPLKEHCKNVVADSDTVVITGIQCEHNKNIIQIQYELAYIFCLICSFSTAVINTIFKLWKIVPVTPSASLKCHKPELCAFCHHFSFSSLQSFSHDCARLQICSLLYLGIWCMMGMWRRVMAGAVRGLVGYLEMFKSSTEDRRASLRTLLLIWHHFHWFGIDHTQTNWNMLSHGAQ